MSLRKMLSTLLGLVLCLGMLPTALADNNNSPVGYWQTYDKQTQQPASIVQIYEEQNTLKGKIVKILKGDTNAVCKNCKGDQKDQPVQGLVILWDLVPTGMNSWGKGRLLDPKTGNILNSQISLANNGNDLQVKASKGVAGRTITWTRTDQPA